MLNQPKNTSFHITMIFFLVFTTFTFVMNVVKNGFSYSEVIFYVVFLGFIFFMFYKTKKVKPTHVKVYSSGSYVGIAILLLMAAPLLPKLFESCKAWGSLTQSFIYVSLSMIGLYHFFTRSLDSFREKQIYLSDILIIGATGYMIFFLIKSWAYTFYYLKLLPLCF